MPNYARRTKWAATILLGVPALCCFVVIVFLFTSCSFNKYLVGAGLPPPDRAFQTGTVAGYNVYVWDCYRGKHIVLYNETSEMRSGPFVREESACGTMTPTEAKLEQEKRRDLDPGYFW